MQTIKNIRNSFERFIFFPPEYVSLILKVMGT